MPAFGILATLLGIVVLAVTERTTWAIPIPAAALLGTVAWSAFRGGIAAGAVSALLTTAYTVWHAITIMLAAHGPSLILRRVAATAAACVVVMIVFARLGARFRRLVRAQAAAAARYARALDSGRLGVWTWERATQAVTWSPEGRRLHGLPTQPPATWEAFQSFVDPVDVPTLGTALSEVQQSDMPVTVTYHIHRPAGEEPQRTIAATLHAERGKTGEVDCVVALCRDITAEQAATAQLRRDEATYRSLVEQSPDAVLVFVAERCVLANAEAARLLGAPTAETLLGREYFTFVDPADHDAVRARIAQIAAGQPAPFAERRLRRLDGTTLVVEAGGALVHFNGQPARQILFRDITERRRAEQLLAAREREVATIVEHTPDVVVRFDPAGRVLYANPAIEAATGIPPHAWLGHTHAELSLPPEHAELWQAAIARVVSSRQPESVGFEFPTPNGPRRFEARIIPEFDETHAVVSMVATGQDVTDLHLSQLALRESEARYRTVVDRLPLGILVHRNEHVLYANPAAARLFHLPLEALYGTAVPACVVPASRQLVRERLAAVQAGVVEQTTPMATMLQRADGATFEAEVQSFAITFDGERAVHTLVRDLTDQRTAEQALRESEARYRLAGRATNDMIWDWNPATGTIVRNEAVTSVFLWPMSDALDFTWFEAQVHPEDRARVLTSLQTALDSGATSWSAVYRFRRGDGTYALVEDRGYIERDPAGRVLRMIGATSDLTERHRLEEELLQAQKMEAVGRLAGGVAHDFNNLLTVITINSAMALQRTPDAPGTSRRELTAIKQAADRAADLTRQLLAFSRRHLLQPRRLDLTQTVTEVQQMLARTIGEDIQLETVLTPDLGSIEADPSQLTQVLLNLAVNARDAMQHGGRLTIATANVDLMQARQHDHGAVAPGAYVLLTVRDTGHGIAPEVMPHLFEPFFTTKEVGKGTGLGLSTVYGIVTQSGGTITVDSAPGDGSTFSVYFPRLVPVTAPAIVPPAPLPMTGGSETILVVEDEADVRTVITGILESQGYNVLEAANGRDAIRVAALFEHPIDLVISDMVMPHMGGREMLAQLTVLRPELRVLVITGYDAERGAELPYPVLLKPFEPSDLLRRVRACLESAGATAP